MIDKLNRNSGLLRLLTVDKNAKKIKSSSPDLVLTGSALLGGDIRQQLTAVPVGQRPLFLAQTLTARVLAKKYQLHDQQSAEYARLSKQICEQLLLAPETAELIDSLLK